MIFEQKFTVHPIGQGLFYTGIIKAETTIFRMVFDCGSFSYAAGAREVDDFIASNLPPNEAIDLLIISHFDGDHINHLKRLLHGGRKVKKLIAPFIEPEERTTLSLRYISEYFSENDPDPAFTCDCIMDITMALRENLDGDSEVILVQHDPNNTPSDGDRTSDELNLTDQSAIEFNFRNKTRSSFQEMGFAGPQRAIYKVLDSQLGKIRTFNIDIVDFIFYKKDIGLDEKTFFKNVYDSFINKFFPGVTVAPTVQEIVDKIKTLRGGTIIKDIFDACYSGLNLSESKTDIKNLNTTALCLLHKNHQPILKKMIESGKAKMRSHAINSIYFLKGRRVIEQLHNLEYPYLFGHHLWIMNAHRHYSIHSNVLLTSDSFLKKLSDVEAFVKHYENFWDQFLIFQIPHHGSRKSADKTLFSKLTIGVIKFINYGINHQFVSQWSHPSPDVLNDLAATSHAVQTFGVNENQGIQIFLEIQ